MAVQDFKRRGVQTILLQSNSTTTTVAATICEQCTPLLKMKLLLGLGKKQLFQKGHMTQVKLIAAQIDVSLF